MNGCRRDVVWGALFVSGSLHILMIWSWRAALPDPGIKPARLFSPMEVRLLPQHDALVPHARSAISQPAQRRIEAPVPVQSRSSEPLVFAPDSASASPSVSLPPQRSVDEMIDAARRDIGRIDRDLRRMYPQQDLRQETNSSALERGIAAAGLPRGTTTWESVSADGRRITKVATASGTYCILGRQPGSGIADNERAAFVTTTCPD